MADRKAHKRVVRRGTERAGDDGSLAAHEATDYSQDPEALREHYSKSNDDDQRILGELPPHWAVFNTEH